MARLLRLVLGGLALVLYTWAAAVRSLPRVKRAKTVRRRSR